MFRLLWVILRMLPHLFAARADVLLEVLALRQQLASVGKRRRPTIRFADRLFWVLLRRTWSRWSEVLLIVKPDTVVGWHRAGFALFWRWRSRRALRAGRPPTTREVQDLVRRMARENSWRAIRIHGELQKLGFDVSERTVSRYLRRGRRRPENRQSWLTFLRNHREVIVAMDFFTVPTVSFRVFYVWFAIRHARREVAHWAVTENPTSAWVLQQLREAFPYEEACSRAKYLVFDRDSTFSAEVVSAAKSMGLKPKRTSYESPWQNGVAERFVGSVRRELLDHVIVLHDRHLRRLLAEYGAYYHEDRTHLGVGKDAPAGREEERRPAGLAVLHARRRVGGLHHRYCWRAAA